MPLLLRPASSPLRRHLPTLALPRSYSTNPPSHPPLFHLYLPPPSGPGHIHLLLLHSPPTRNALSLSILLHLHSALSTLQNSTPSTSRGLILASTNPTTTFCAGADLKERATFTPEQTTSFLTSLRKAFSILSTLPLPTISAINGPALGGGLEIALSTDFRVVGPTATLGLPETKLGIIPGAGGTYRLPALIGESKALELILTGRRISASESLSLGVATRIATPEADMANEDLSRVLKDHGIESADDVALRGAVKLMGEICTGGPIAIRAAKEAVRKWRGGEEVENAAYEKVVGTRDRDEALRAFREKRKPVFKGE